MMLMQVPGIVLAHAFFTGWHWNAATKTFAVACADTTANIINDVRVR